ncbi:MAG: hypothetical protein IJD11_04220 [Oscillospiraceae bacterium]|nr:hypothetical protein [Oscillospiraceae bacterium]
MKTNQFDTTSPFYFNGSMTEEILRRYVSRAVTFQPMSVSDPLFEENLRLIKNIGAKYIGRAASFSWSGHMSYEQVENYYKLAEESARLAHEADPELIFQAGVFEIIYRQTVENQPIPAWVFNDFGLVAEDRNFNWEEMCFPLDFEFPETPWGNWSDRNRWNREAAWPFIGSLETQMYFYYSICRYIDAGFEAIHLGQAERMCGCRWEFYTGWDRVTTLARKYAKTHARRGIVLFDCHTVFGSDNMKIGNRLLIDIVAAGMIPTDYKEEDGALKCKLYTSDQIEQTWIGRSEGGEHPLGFKVDVCPTIVEFDNYGRPGPAGVYNEVWHPWGYDDITWFTVQPEWYRNEFLLYCDKYMKTTCLDKKGNQCYFLQSQLRRCISCDGDEPVCKYIPGADFDQVYFDSYTAAEEIEAEKQEDGSYILRSNKNYRANTQSDACPNGFNQEETIKKIFLNPENGITR